MAPFTGFRIRREDGAEKAAQIAAGFEQLTLDDLSPGEVVVRVEYSSINYKDALAVTGRGAILRRFPLVGGIDLAGRVVESTVSQWRAGDAVLVCGSGLSETRDGGYTELARVPADAVVAVPEGLDTRSAMIVGTAGLAAALGIDRLERAGIGPALGPIAVTGATGGVGSLALDMLAASGYETVAITGKPEQAADLLHALGASRIVDRRSLELDGKPLGPAELGGAVDNLGGEVLAWLLSRTRPAGAVASIGLAQSPKLETTVLPFILRGVSLLGINSVSPGAELRNRIWHRLGTDLRPPHLDRILTREIDFDALPSAFDAYFSGGVTGRTIVRFPAD